MDKESLFYSLLAGSGGMLGYTIRQVNGDKKINWFRILIEGAASAFVGVIVFWACQEVGFSQRWTAVTVAVSGWLGATVTMHSLEKLVFKKLGVPKNADD